MQLKKLVNIALFAYNEIFLRFFFGGGGGFQDYMPNSSLSCLLLKIKVFFKNLQEAVFSWKKFNNLIKGQIKFSDVNYNMKQEKKSFIFKCSSQAAPAIQVDPRPQCVGPGVKYKTR